MLVVSGFEPWAFECQYAMIITLLPRLPLLITIIQVCFNLFFLRALTCLATITLACHKHQPHLVLISLSISVSSFRFVWIRLVILCLCWLNCTQANSSYKSSNFFLNTRICIYISKAPILRELFCPNGLFV